MFHVIGTTTLDHIVNAPDRAPERAGDEFTTESLVFCDDPPSMLLGGNGGNTAYVLRALGAPTALCSGIGQDLPGDILLNWLARAGVDLSNVVRDAEKCTSSTTVVLDKHQNRQAYHHHGASAICSPEHFPTGDLSNNDVLLLTGYPLMTGWHSPETVSVLRQARHSGAATAVDIGPAIGTPVELNEMRPCLPHIDYVLCNEHEMRSAVKAADDLPAAVEQLRAAGAKTVIVKQGAEGASFLTHGIPTVQSAPGFSVDAEQTVGAGDSFNAGFLFARKHGFSIRQAVRFANAVAASVVASGQGVLGCPTRREVLEFIAGSVRDKQRADTA